MARILDTFPDPAYDPADASGVEGVVVLGGGCFWCVEGVFRQMPGVTDVVSGYAGGDAATANYKAVCEGDTGHIEVVAVHFDPALVSLGQILKTFFWLAHDPTQENGQGNDIGPQYHSAIFVSDEAQARIAQEYIDQIEAAGLFERNIVTKVMPLTQFFRAEDYHQNYAALNPGQGYIMGVATPKITRARDKLNR